MLSGQTGVVTITTPASWPSADVMTPAPTVTGSPLISPLAELEVDVDALASPDTLDVPLLDAAKSSGLALLDADVLA